MLNWLYVGLGGFVGAVLRYFLSITPLSYKSVFPFVTMGINFGGAFLIGAVVALASKGNLSPQMMLFLKVGLCGGFTTFSTFSLEVLMLLESGRLAMALTYIALSVVLCVLGVYLAQSILG